MWLKGNHTTNTTESTLGFLSLYFSAIHLDKNARRGEGLPEISLPSSTIPYANDSLYTGKIFRVFRLLDVIGLILLQKTTLSNSLSTFITSWSVIHLLLLVSSANQTDYTSNLSPKKIS